MTNKNPDTTEFKRLEKALGESEKRYRSLFEESRDAIYFITREGKVVDANKAALDLFGYTKEDLPNFNVVEMYENPADRLKFQQEIEEKGAVRDYGVRMRRKDGTVLDCLLTTTVWQANDGSTLGYQGIIRDITEYKKAEKALQESEEKLRAILTGIGDYITIQDKDLDIIWVNQPTMDLYGDIIGKKCYKVYHELEENCSNCASEKVFNEGKTVVWEGGPYRESRPKYSLVTSSPVRDIEGNVVAMVEVTKDITERKEMEQQLKNYAENLEKLVEERTLELRESEERYRGLYDSSIDGIASTKMDGNIIECNQAFSDMFGYSKEEIKKMNYLEFIPGKWRDIVARIINEQILPRGFSDVLEIEGCKKDGIIFPASARLWVINDINGNSIGMWALIRDITERKKLEGKLKSYTEKLKRLDEERAEELKRKTVQLEALNKELESFSYSVSHDLRAPLRSIDGFSKALLDDYAEILDDEGKHYLNRVRKATQRMAELIDELLALSRVTRSEMRREKIDLSEIAQEISLELQESQPKRLVDFIIEPGLVADGDSRLLRAVLENLLINAWKFTGKKHKAQIEFGVTWKGVNRVFFVQDNGAGFNMEYSNKLFGAFQRLHSPDEFPGIGVGLATVKRIINRHGGRVWAEGEVDKGATFYFTL